MSALMTLTVTTHTPPLSRDAVQTRGLRAALRVRNLYMVLRQNIDGSPTRHVTGQAPGGQGERPSRTPPSAQEGGWREREGSTFPSSPFLLPPSFNPPELLQHRRRQAPRGASVLSVLRRLRVRQQLLHLPSQRLRPLSGQRLGKRLVALELAGPLAAALGDVPVAEGAAAGAGKQGAEGGGHR